MGKEPFRIAAGTDVRDGDMFRLNAGFLQNNAVGRPKIQMEFIFGCATA